MDSSKILTLPHLQWSPHDKKKVTFWKIYNIWVKPFGQVFSKEDNVWLDNTLPEKKKNTLASSLLVANVRYIKMLPWLQDFSDKIASFHDSVVSQFSEETWPQRKPKQIQKNDQKASESC